MIGATSASDRLAAAREALAAYDAGNPDDPAEENLALAEMAMDALRALVTPAETMEAPEQIAGNIMLKLADNEPFVAAGISQANLTRHIHSLMVEAVHAGIQAAWESWEPDDYAHEYGD